MGSKPKPDQLNPTKKPWQRSWFWFVIVPFICFCCYFSIIASDRYIGETKVVVKQAGSNISNQLGIPLLGSSISPGMQDAQLVREFVLSMDMLHHLDKVLNLKAHYQNTDADIFSRLLENESKEAFLAYYREHLSVNYDQLSGILTIRAQAFTPEFAQNIVRTILQHSEKYINEISHQLAEEQVSFAEKELNRAGEQLRQSKRALLEFQELYQLFSPEQESRAKLKVVNELEAELTRYKTDLNNLQSYMNDTAADVVAMKAKINALDNQLLIERRKLVGNGENNLSDLSANAADLRISLEFSTDLYKTSLMSLEQARIEAYRKLKYLVVVDSPSLPEEAEFPRRIYNLITIFVILSLSYGSLLIIYATIREHRDV